ncbi:unnamed protein product [Pedinophyceae sp. YPF-701]|nr:unnamed protein product [Pedinophyceae sp. YPF-701]
MGCRCAPACEGNGNGVLAGAPGAADDAPHVRHLVEDVLKLDFRSCPEVIQGAKVVVRADLNVPLSRDGTVLDELRVIECLPTIRALVEMGAAVVVLSHMGRPKPSKMTPDELQRLSLAKVAPIFERELGADTFLGFRGDCLGQEARDAAAAAKPGQVVLLENTRFHAGDEQGSEEMARQLAKLGNVFVLDAFGTCHRDHASVSGLSRCMGPGRRFPGLLVRRECEFLVRTLGGGGSVCCVVGGAKVADKLQVLFSLVDLASIMIVGGRMAFTFLAAQGVAVGDTVIEPDLIDDAKHILARAKERNIPFLLPEDVVAGTSLDGGETKVLTLTAGCCTRDAPCMRSGEVGGDIGPATVARFTEAIRDCGCSTLFWNGPLGRYEAEEYSRGTAAVARAVAEATKAGVTTVVGGGDSAACLLKLGLAGSVSHLSTGGGATLEMIQGESMPGLRALAGWPIP